MQKFKAKIIDPIGLHARPISILVAEATKFEAILKINFENQEANLKSIMDIMALGVGYGKEVTITASGKDETLAIAKIKLVMQTNNLILT